MAIAYNSLINWTWYLDYTVQESGKAIIHKHWRMHHSDIYNHPQATNEFRLVEDKDRIVQQIVIGYGTERNTIEVENKQHVFSYK